MEGSSRNPQLRNFIQRGTRVEEEEKKLELRLGPPGEDWFHNKDKNETSLKPYPPNFLSSPWGSSSSTRGGGVGVGVGVDHSSSSDNKGCSSQPSVPAKNTAVNTNSSQKRGAPPVVGWPPVRSFRKNLANTSSSSKQVSDSQTENPPKEVIAKQESGSSNKGLFVKINMDGVPIGRKVDLKAYNSYEKLSTAVDELFRGLLAAQKDSPGGGNHNKMEDVKEITGLLDGSGEYTLVYEDNEGDRMLVGDVPWEMFASTVRRLRVLKSSELSALRLGSCKQEKIPFDPARR